MVLFQNHLKYGSESWESGTIARKLRFEIYWTCVPYPLPWDSFLLKPLDYFPFVQFLQYTTDCVNAHWQSRATEDELLCLDMQSVQAMAKAGLVGRNLKIILCCFVLCLQFFFLKLRALYIKDWCLISSRPVNCNMPREHNWNSKQFLCAIGHAILGDCVTLRLQFP